MFENDYITLAVAVVSAAVGSSLLTYTVMILRSRESADSFRRKGGLENVGGMLPKSVLVSSRLNQILSSTLVKENVLINIDLIKTGDLVEARFDINYVMRNMSPVAQVYSFVTTREEKDGQPRLLRIDGKIVSVDEGDNQLTFNQVIQPSSLVAVSRSFSLSSSMPFLHELVESSMVLGGMRVQLRTQIDSEVFVRLVGRPFTIQTTGAAERLRMIQLITDDLLLPGDTLLVGAGIGVA
jgi:hypothetical protein